MSFVISNGKIFGEKDAVMLSSNSAYQSGFGLFETMKYRTGELLLKELHFERLLEGLKILNIAPPPDFTAANIEEQVIKLTTENDCKDKARIRLTASLQNKKFHYLVQAFPLQEITASGLSIGVFEKGKKTVDHFSNLKTCSRLLYILAGDFAKENNWDDCLILNQHDRICESTIANIFWVKNEVVFTPPLSEGPVAGVMRKFILQKIKEINFFVQEKECTLNDLITADEIFLTNVIRGIQAIKHFNSTTYGSRVIAEIRSAIQY
ncbi:MAG: hypothetical protein C4308_00460 [Chitinophagaceae bacterium]